MRVKARHQTHFIGLITCSAVALSRVLRTALVPYGNMETLTPHSSETSQVIMMKLCTFDYVRETNTCAKFGCTQEIYTSCEFSSFLLFFLTALFFLRTCTGQTDRDNFTQNGSKDAVWRKEVPSQQVFFSHFPFLGSFCPKTPKISPH